jgi:hypothetical protein
MAAAVAATAQVGDDPPPRGASLAEDVVEAVGETMNR